MLQPHGQFVVICYHCMHCAFKTTKNWKITKISSYKLKKTFLKFVNKIDHFALLICEDE